MTSLWTQWLFEYMLFNSHVLVSTFLLLLISSFIPLWLGKIFGMISVLLNLLRLFSGLAWSTLQNVPWVLRENLFLLLLGGIFCIRFQACSVYSFQVCYFPYWFSVNDLLLKVGYCSPPWLLYCYLLLPLDLVMFAFYV